VEVGRCQLDLDPLPLVVLSVEMLEQRAVIRVGVYYCRSDIRAIWYSRRGPMVPQGSVLLAPGIWYPWLAPKPGAEAGNNAQSWPPDARDSRSVAGAVAARTTLAANSTPPGPSLPPRDWSTPNPTVPYPDVNVQVLDPRFKKYIAGTRLLRPVWAGPSGPRGRCGSATCTV